MRYVLNEELHDLARQGRKSKLGKKLDIGIVKMFVRRLQEIERVEDERGLRQFKGWHFETLERSDYERSIRLIGQWRLILWFEEDAERPYMFINKIEDYH